MVKHKIAINKNIGEAKFKPVMTWIEIIK